MLGLVVDLRPVGGKDLPGALVAHQQAYLFQDLEGGVVDAFNLFWCEEFGILFDHWVAPYLCGGCLAVGD